MIVPLVKVWLIGSCRWPAATATAKTEYLPRIASPGKNQNSKLRKEYNKAVYCHPVYLTYMQSTSCEMPVWMNYKLEWILLGAISTASEMHVTHSNGRKWGTEEPLDEG